MTGLTALYAALVALLAVMALLAMSGWRHRAGAAVGLFIVLLALWYGGLATLLGRAKPIMLETMARSEVRVLHYTLVEGEGIYLLLQLEEPRLYVMVWNEEAAKQLMAAEQGGKGRGVVMKDPFRKRLFEPGLDARRLFHPAPQAAFPPKP